jgi:hypothetical protein
MGEDVYSCNPYTLLVEMQNGATSLENSEVPQNVEHGVSMCPSSLTPGNMLKKIKLMTTQKCAYAKIHSQYYS